MASALKATAPVSVALSGGVFAITPPPTVADPAAAGALVRKRSRPKPRPPLSIVTQKVTSWTTDEQGNLHRECYAVVIDGDTVTRVVPAGAHKGADTTAYRRQLAIYEALDGKHWTAVDDLALQFAVADRTALRDVARLHRLGLVETRMGTRRGRHAREVRRVAG